MGLIKSDTFMVLKIFIIFILSIFSLNVQSANRTVYLKKAQILYTKGNYDKSIEMLNKFYNLKEPKKLPSSVLNLLGLIYQKKKEFRLSSKVFNQVIRKSYFKEHQKVVRALNNGGLQDLNISPKLLRIYYHLGQNYYYIYSKTDNFNYFNASLSFFRICKSKNHLNNNVQRYLDSLNAKLDYIKSLEKSIKFYLSGGGILFQETIDIVNNNDSDDVVGLISNNNGVCFGGGMTYGNISHGWDIFACGYSAVATITNKVGSSLSYKQKDVSVNGLYISPGYFFRPEKGISSIGLSTPLFYRQGNFSNTENYSIRAQGQLSAGITFDAKWEIIKDYTLDFKLSNLGGTNIYMSNLSFHF